MLLKFKKFLSNHIPFIILLIFVLVVNSQIISFDMIYPEQPYIYVANASINSLSDLLDVYLHPKVFNIFNVPFFRPSGHFLLYQLVTPLIGWHNTKALLVINLTFLALTGLLMIKIYNLLFPKYKMGGYLAFSIYLMHPALILSRLIILHFEFAYTFFSLLSLYCFIQFCQRNRLLVTKHYQYLSLFFLSLFFFAVAVTFKEPALMLGGVLMLYFALTFFQRLFNSKESVYVLLLIFILSTTLAVYMTLAWPTIFHPSTAAFTVQQQYGAAIELLNYIVGITHSSHYREVLFNPAYLWRETISPLMTRCLLIALAMVTVSCCISLCLKRHTTMERKSFLFLLISSLLFLLLPIGWGIGMPWHLSPTLIFLSLLMGFSVDYFFQRYIKNTQRADAALFVLSILVGLTTLVVNRDNIQHVMQRQGFAAQLAYNAIHHPPVLNSQLNNQSIIVIENSHHQDSYYLGNSYDKAILNARGYNELEKITQFSQLKVDALYGGTFFQWAYLQTPLKEEIESVTLDDLSELSDKRIYVWLQNYTNVFYFTYDDKAKWHDATNAFRAKLSQEKAQRGLTVHSYQSIPAAALTAPVMYTLTLGFPDHQLCQYRCDEDKSCGGFTYFNNKVNNISSMKCLFYSSVRATEKKFCPLCESYIKQGT